MQNRHLLKNAAAALAAAGVEDSLLEAELLLRHCLGVSRSGLFLLQEQEMKPEQADLFSGLLRRRCQREPLQQIAGHCEFWSLDFLVTPAVLIPRPETEFVLEHVLATLARAGQRPQLALDLCTGSGVIAAVLAKELPSAHILAADCSWDALAVARQNIRRHDLENRIQLLCADLLSSFPSAPMFDLIVSNPPYIKSGDLLTLQAEVRDWEPHLALSGGGTGMDCIRPVCADAAALLRPGGWLFLEIGADLGEETEKTLAAQDGYEQIGVLADWSGRPRVAQARKKG
jgi:release factor glutamine methyltransferase